MTRLELLQKINRARSLKIHQRLIEKKIVWRLEKAASYKDVDPALLEDVRYMTGNDNGIAMTDSRILFIVKAKLRHGGDPIVSFTLNFGRTANGYHWDGKYLEISDIVYRMDAFCEGEERKDAFDEEVTQSVPQLGLSVDEFINRAVERGYLMNVL